MTTPPEPGDEGQQPPPTGEPPPYPPQQPPYPPSYPPPGTPAQPGYPPPPPYGAQPPYGQDPYAQTGYVAPQYAPWGTRVGASLLDSLVSLGPYLVAVVIGAGSPDLAPLLTVIGALATLGIWVWNRIIRAGQTGQSLGKTWTSIYLVDEATGQPLGPGGAFVRELLHILDGFCWIGYIVAAFDSKVQTFADKLKGSIVVRG